MADTAIVVTTANSNLNTATIALNTALNAQIAAAAPQPVAIYGYSIGVWFTALSFPSYVQTCLIRHQG